MKSEIEPIKITSLRIELESQTITLESDTVPVGRFRFALGGLYYEPPQIAASNAETDQPESATTPINAAEDLEHGEKDQSVVLQGKILGRVREGRPDSRGRKTA